MLLDEGLVLCLDLVLELVHLVVHNLELALHLGEVVLRLDEALRVLIAVRAHGLVHVLLGLELGLAVGDRLVQLADARVLHLDLRHRRPEALHPLRCLGAEPRAAALELLDRLLLLGRLGLAGARLLLERPDRLRVHFGEVQMLPRRVTDRPQRLLQRGQLGDQPLARPHLRRGLPPLQRHLVLDRQRGAGHRLDLCPQLGARRLEAAQLLRELLLPLGLGRYLASFGEHRLLSALQPDSLLVVLCRLRHASLLLRAHALPLVGKPNLSCLHVAPRALFEPVLRLDRVV
mmetsp:Transcript_10714/g.35502  ORF Transcript_10714/g.35502 Transcript_10714/m.35502 type:complete len:289 (-) Transcript_10714:777-1643(-)